jgi:predicted neuraminidase
MLQSNRLAPRAFAVLFSVLQTGTLSAADLKEQPGYVRGEFIYDTAPFPSCHASTIVETHDGLLAAWFGGTYERHPDVAIYTSRFENGRWSPPQEVANGVESPEVRHPTWNPVLFRPKEGPLMLFYKVGPTPSSWWGMKMTSDDEGRTWSTPVRLPDGILGPIKNKPVELATGEIVSPTSSEHDGWRVHFERSVDGGKSWTAGPPVNDADGARRQAPHRRPHERGWRFRDLV